MVFHFSSVSNIELIKFFPVNSDPIVLSSVLLSSEKKSQVCTAWSASSLRILIA